MIFNNHSNLRGQHAFMSPSQHAWTNYDADKFASVYRNRLAIERGERLHDLACRLIEDKIRLVNNKKTLNAYVNSAIALKMKPERVLYYSPKCFGTADAINFDGEILRVHDLKTGKNIASFRQLEVYAALFMLEYGVSPFDIPIEMRIYQNDDCRVESPDPNTIQMLSDKIVTFDQIAADIDEENRGD